MLRRRRRSPLWLRQKSPSSWKGKAAAAVLLRAELLVRRLLSSVHCYYCCFASCSPLLEVHMLWLPLCDSTTFIMQSCILVGSSCDFYDSPAARSPCFSIFSQILDEVELRSFSTGVLLFLPPYLHLSLSRVLRLLHLWFHRAKLTPLSSEANRPLASFSSKFLAPASQNQARAYSFLS